METNRHSEERETRFIQRKINASKMAQQVRVLATKTDNLSLMSTTQVMEEEN